MSLNRAALRIATVLALKGRTFAGEAVFDSRNAGIDEILVNEAVPVISVYTDEDQPNDTRLVNLVIECAVSVLQTAADAEPRLWTPATDPMMELQLDFIEAQISDALADPDNAAADVWRRFASIEKVSSQRGLFGVESDTRLAARQRLITVRLLKDGEGPMIAAIERLLALMEADSEYAVYAPHLRAFALRHSGRDKGRIDAARLMIPVGSLKALRLVYGAAGGEPGQGDA